MLFVTGATGKTGQKLVKYLSEKNERFQIGVRSPEKTSFVERKNIEIINFDFMDINSINTALKNVDKLFLLTPIIENQVEITKQIVDVAKKSGVNYIVKLSAIGSEDNRDLQLIRWHRETDRYIEESGISFTILRPNSFMDNFINYGASIKTDGKLYMPRGEGKVSYISVEDVAAVACEVLTTKGHKNKIYDITGPEAISVSDVALAISKATGRPVEYVDIPEKIARQTMESAGYPKWMTEILMEVNNAIKAGTLSEVTTVARDITGKFTANIKEWAIANADAFK
ncbi:MAG: SDR family oxidoreductase [Deltaproteobacteria bacterium]|nr:SDR family oxidoreductase [Deltaproteobacteria bacterium]